MGVNWIEVWTDGSCKPNPGAGGWGCVILNENHRHELCGGTPYTTNFRMEMLAVIRVLEEIEDPNFFLITTDCKPLVDGVASRKTLKDRGSINKDLWRRLDAAISKHREVRISWRPGHGEDVHNIRADELAKGASAHAAENGEFELWLS